MSIPRHKSPTSQDPYEWSVEDVIDSLCSPHGLLSLTHPNCRAAPDFANVLRDNDITGAMLLTEVDRDLLRSDFGVKSAGKRGAVIDIINHLRSISQKYIDVCQRNAAVSFAAGHGGQSNFDHASAYGVSTNSHALPAFPRAVPSNFFATRRNLRCG